MKKTLILMAVVLIATLPANAQLGNIANKVKKSAAKAIDKRIDKAVDSTVNNVFDKAFGKVRPSNNASVQNTDGAVSGTVAVLSPMSAIGEAPEFPTQQSVIDYACENIKANPSSLKLLANPVTRYFAKINSSILSMVSAWQSSPEAQARVAEQRDQYLMASLGVTAAELEAMSEEEREALYQKKQEEYLNNIGLTSEDAKAVEGMSDEEAYAYLSSKMSAKAMEDAMSGKMERSIEAAQQQVCTYKPAMDLYEQYNDVSSKVDDIYSKSYTACRELWESKYANKVGSMTNERLLSQYLNEALPLHFASMKSALELRRTEQMSVAEQLDKMLAEHPEETKGLTASYLTYSLTFAQCCAVAYLNEGNNITGYYMPNIDK